MAGLEDRITTLEAERAKSRQATEAQPEPPPSETSRVTLSDRDSSVVARKTFREDHDAAPRPGNAASDAELNGFFALGATGVWLKLAGYAKLDLIVDSAAMGNPNKFATSSIYTTSDAGYDQGARFNLHAKQSRLGFEARTSTKVGSLRVVYENDFYGDGTGPSMTYNLRHLYGQLANFTVGQTWTTYFDSDAIPDTLDFAGPGVLAIRRVPQIRYNIPFSSGTHLAFAAEQPGSDLAGLPTDAVARNLAPDVTMAFRLEDRQVGHLHVGAVARLLSYDDAASDLHTEFGFSTNVSGVLNLFDKDHVIVSGTIGRGTGHYAQDLASSAAVVTDDGSLDALFTWGALAGYRHFWADTVSSQATYGYLELERRDELAADAYRGTHYAQANIVWSPAPRFYLGVEYLYGHKTDQGGSSGDAHRGQLAVKYNLF